MNLKSKSISALTRTPTDTQDLFSDIDPATLDLPDKISPMESAYHQTIEMEPDTASKVLKLSSDSGQSPEFVADNMDAVKKAAAVPPSHYFDDITKKYPETASFLSDPRNMARGKDDIENMSQTEDLVQQHGFFRDKWNSIMGFVEKYDKPLLPLLKLAPPVDPKFNPILARAQAPGRGLLAGLEGLTTPSNLALMAATGGLESVAPLASRALSGVFAYQMGHGLVQQAAAFKDAIARGDDVAALNIGGEMVVSGYMTKETLTHALAAPKPKPGATPITDTPMSYSEIGKRLKDSKLADRAPDAHGDFLANVTKGSDFENITVPAKGFDTYFQDKNLNSDEIAQKLGIGGQLAEARGRGGDIKVPFSAWAREFAKTPHYEGLKNDIRFNQDALTPNEVESLGQTIQAKVDSTVEAAKTANPAWDEGLKKITDDFQKQLVDSKAYTPKDAAVQAEAGAKIIERLAAMTGEPDPEAYLQKHPIQIINGQMVPAEGTLNQGGVNAPNFYSQVERTLKEKMPEKASAEQIGGILRNAAGVKQEELQWLGIDDFLAEHPTATKQEVLDFVKQNEVQIKEVAKGSPGKQFDETEALKRFKAGEEVYGIDENGNESLIENESDVENFQVFATGDSFPEGVGNTKFQQYQLPGGDNYRELLLTMPSEGENVQSQIDGLSDKIREEEANRNFYPVRSEKWNSFNKKIEALMDERDSLAKQSKPPDFKSSHFDEPNVLAHVRFNDRIIPAEGAGKFNEDYEKWVKSGKKGDAPNPKDYGKDQKVLFLEEVQSDWHQKGREKGYKSGMRSFDEINDQANSINAEMARIMQEYEGRRPLPQEVSDKLGELNNKYRALVDESNVRSEAVPDAPFKKSWHELALKRMLRYAAENGYDKIAWTTGEQQAERYDLSKQINAVEVRRGADGYVIDMKLKDGRRERVPEMLAEDKLQDYVGKDLAEKIKKDFSSLSEEKVGSFSKSYSGLDLKVGGEGMKGFYDQMIPSFLNKYAKKWGGKVGETNIGTGKEMYAIYNKVTGNPVGGGYDLLDAKKRIIGNEDRWEYRKEEGGNIPVHSLELTTSMKQSVLNGQPLFQEGQDPTINPRASISFQPDKALINLRNADPSSFMHEMGHYWLKNFSDHIQSGKADERATADWGILSKWLDIAEGQKELTVDQQEKFAKGFERYLYEGKAPSDNLRSAFNKFRTWLSNVYRDPASLGADLTPEVLGVMDRMLASEDEIKFAEQQAGLGENRDYSNLDLDPKIIARLDSLREEAHDSAFQELFGKQMEEISKENQAKLTQEAVNARVKADAEVRGSEIQQAIRAVSENFSGDPIKRAQDYWLDKIKPEDRAKFDQLAEARGYESGSSMAYKMIQEPPIEQSVQARVDQHMEQFAALKDTGKIKEAALAAVHNEKSTELMARETAIFEDLVDQAKGRIVDQKLRAQKAKIEADAAKLRAQQTVSGLPTSEARKFMPYFTAERNAAVRVKKALMEGNFEEAAKAKREQMLNHALVKESYAFRQEYDKTLRFFDRFASRGNDLKGLPYGFMRQIDTLLSDHGLADPRVEDLSTYLVVAKDMAKLGEDPEEIVHRTGWMQDSSGNWKRESLTDTVARIQNDYRNLAIPDSAINGIPTDYRQMKVGDFRDLKTAVKAINAVGRGYDNFLDENIKMDRKEAAARFRQFVEQNIGSKYAERRDIGTKADMGKAGEIVQKISDIPNAAIPSLVNLYRICDFLDGGKEDGLMKTLVYRPLLHAERGEIAQTEQAIKEMDKIHDAHWKDGDFEKLKKEKVHIASRDRDMTRDEILAVAMNQGTEVNRQRVQTGFNLAPEQLAEILSHVDKKQWDYVQAVWDHTDKYWPQIVKLQERVSGESPVKVKASPADTPYGQYKGGYYPLVYDHTRSADALKNVDARNALYKTMGPAVAHTDHGFTESRLRNYVAPVKFDTDVIYTHLQDVIHDLSYRQQIIDASGFLRQRDTKEAIVNAIGLDGYKAVGQHLKWIASADSEPIHLADRLLRRLRFTGTTAMLGLRPLNFPMDLTGNLISAISDIGPKQMTNAIKDFVSNREANVKFVEDNSPRMAKRATFRDRDLVDMGKRYRGEESVMQHFIFWGASKADEAISFPLWLSVYNRSLEKMGHTGAVDLADEAVTRAVGSGSVLDQANIQRGSELKKIFTWWYSWSGMQFNRMWAEGKIAGLAYDKGNIGTALTALGTSALYGWVLQGANENFWREFFRNSQGDDPEKKKKRITQRMIMQGIGYVPIVRDIAQYELGKIMGTHADIQLPFQDSIKSLADPFADMIRAGLTDGTLSPRFWENSSRAAAMSLGYPQYINNVAFNFLDNLNGMGEGNWRDLLVRKTKD